MDERELGNADESNAAGKGFSRRTLAKGAAWAVPAIAVAAAAPTAAASIIPCVGAISLAGGTYPVSVNIFGCNVSGAHWDFQFKFTAQVTPGCTCGATTPTHVRIRFYDNPQRSSLWYSTYNRWGGWINPIATSRSEKYYVERILAIGQSHVFPSEGDIVRRAVNGNPITGSNSSSTITAHGTTDDDALHALYTPPNSASPANCSQLQMASYTIDCGSSASGPWTPLVPETFFTPCVPMIQVDSACLVGDGASRLNLSVVQGCTTPNSNFVITQIRRNGSSDFPGQGSPIWTGSQAVGAGTQITTNTGGYGGQLWIYFTPDGGQSESVIRIPRPGNTC